MKNHIFSKAALFFAMSVLFYASFVFYPKWNKPQTEATIGWDVAGYYFYLPAFFIYKDPFKVAFRDSIQKKYNPQTDYYSSSLYPATGNQVMKYSGGMAIMYAPTFFVAHALAKPLGFPADGFSLPYQFAIQFWSLLVAFLGLFVMRKVLLKLNFDDKSVAFTIVAYVLATNYLDYASITNAMSHNYIFTLYALLLWFIINFNGNTDDFGQTVSSEFKMQNVQPIIQPPMPNFLNAIGIGTTLGLAILARPSELPIVLLPIFWGIASWRDVQGRIVFYKKNIFSFALIIFTFLAWISLQLIYWKKTTGKFLYNSYGENEDFFDWKRPHILDGLFSAQKGWFVYTPIMIFAMIGLWLLYKNHRRMFFPITIFLVAFIYVSFAYKIWWYAASIGQRQMIQIYSILAIPFTAFVQWMFNRLQVSGFRFQELGVRNQKSEIENRKSKIENLFAFPVFILFFGVCVYMNIFWTYNAHGGGNFDGENMTRAYFWRVLGKTTHDRDDDKLLDNKYDVQGTRENVQVIYTNNFETDTVSNLSTDAVIAGKKSLYLDKDHQVTDYLLPLPDKNKHWLRANATFYIDQKEWDKWKMSKLVVYFKNKNQIVRVNEIRLQRLMNDRETRRLWIDAKIPKSDFDSVFLRFDNNGGNKKIWIDDVSVEVF